MISMFFDKQLSISLCFNTMLEKNNLFIAWLQRISADSNENYIPYNF